jgi:hypothetical protein
MNILPTGDHYAHLTRIARTPQGPVEATLVHEEEGEEVGERAAHAARPLTNPRRTHSVAQRTHSGIAQRTHAATTVDTFNQSMHSDLDDSTGGGGETRFIHSDISHELGHELGHEHQGEFPSSHSQRWAGLAREGRGIGEEQSQEGARQAGWTGSGGWGAGAVDWDGERGEACLESAPFPLPLPPSFPPSLSLHPVAQAQGAAFMRPTEWGDGGGGSGEGGGGRLGPLQGPVEVVTEFPLAGDVEVESFHYPGVNICV